MQSTDSEKPWNDWIIKDNKILSNKDWQSKEEKQLISTKECRGSRLESTKLFLRKSKEAHNYRRPKLFSNTKEPA